jgi:hypothetical protein
VYVAKIDGGLSRRRRNAVSSMMEMCGSTRRQSLSQRDRDVIDGGLSAGVGGWTASPAPRAAAVTRRSLCEDCEVGDSSDHGDRYQDQG